MWYRVQVKRQAFSAWEDIHGGTDLDQAIAFASQAKSSGALAARVIDADGRSCFSC
jgi:hypothetical protein